MIYVQGSTLEVSNCTFENINQNVIRASSHKVTAITHSKFSGISSSFVIMGESSMDRYSIEIEHVTIENCRVLLNTIIVN